MLKSFCLSENEWSVLLHTKMTSQAEFRKVQFTSGPASLPWATLCSMDSADGHFENQPRFSSGSKYCLSADQPDSNELSSLLLLWFIFTGRRRISLADDGNISVQPESLVWSQALARCLAKLWCPELMSSWSCLRSSGGAIQVVLKPEA